jgi:hypothetical protein
MDAKLALGVVITLSFIEAFIPVAFGFASVQFGSLPSFPALLFLGGLVKLVLLVLPASVDKSSGFLNDVPVSRRESRAGRAKHASSYQPPERPDSPVKGTKDQSSKDAQLAGHVSLELQHVDKQQRHKVTKQQQPFPDTNSPQQHPTFAAGSSSKHWQLLLLSAVCSAIAANIMLSLIPELAPFAWSQLPLLQVLALAVLAQFSSSRARVTFSGTSIVACWMLLLAIILGQGYIGSQPQSLGTEQEAASILQASGTAMPARSQLQPIQVLAWAALAAALSTASGRLLLLARTASSSRHQQQPSQQHLCILQCVLYILCNLVWFLIKDGTLDTLLDDITPPHWHAVLLLGVSGLLRTTVSCWPPQEELVAKGYAFQGAVVLAAWASSILLDAPQTTQFAFSSFLAGLAVLLLHHGQHVGPSTQHYLDEDSSSSWQQRMQGLLHSEVKSRRITARALRNMLSYVWLIVTFVLLAVTAWAHLTHSGAQGHKYSFSHPASAHALEKAGISTAHLMACSKAPLPLTQLYYSSSVAAASASQPQPPAPSGTGNRSSHSSSTSAAAGNLTDPGAAAAAPKPLVPVATPLAAANKASLGWDLCPALTCSQDPTCTAANSTCCAHLLLNMAAFWDVFMHTHGLSSQYTLLYDTLSEALGKGSLGASTDRLHLGVSAQALAVLERACLKTELWQHGYALFLQGDSWRLCAHRQHPSETFRSHMHPVRHLTPVTSSGSLTLHVMWPLDGQSLMQAAGSASDSALPAKQAAGSAAANATGHSQTQQQKQTNPLSPLKSWVSSGRSAAHTWMVCSTRDVLTTGPVLTATLDGLRMPRPVAAGLSSGGSTAAVSSTQRYRAANRKADPACQKLIGELLARMEA